MKKHISHIKFLVRLVCSHSKRLIPYMLLQNLNLVMLSILSILMPKFIIDGLMNRIEFTSLLYIILIFSGVIFGISQINNILVKATQVEKDKVCLELDNLICTSTAKIEYKFLENPKYLDLKARLEQYNCSSYLAVLEGFFGVLRYIMIIISVASIISLQSFSMILLIGIIIFINGVANKRKNQNSHKFFTLLMPIDRKIFSLTNLLTDFSYGKEVRLNNMTPFITEKYQETAKEANDVLKKYLAFTNKADYLRFFMDLIQTVVVYGYLVYDVIVHSLSIGNFTMYFSAINELSNSLNAIVTSTLEIIKMSLHIDDLKEFLSLETDENGEGHKDIPKSPYVFEFIDVSFKYEGSDDFTLENINIKIDFAQKLSIVGLNGAGKTTFIKLLTRLYEPTEGKILLNGIDILEFELDKYYDIFSVVFQDFKLFAMSINENIHLSHKYNSDDIEKVLNESGLLGKVCDLSNGGDTQIHKIFDENGIELSGGQAQKLAISRALYKNSPVVILDEPTSALDPRAEYEIYKLFDQLVKNKTAIYITHKLSSTRFCDVVAVFEGGHIVEYGSHDELMKNNGLYNELFSKQAEFYVNT